MTYLKCNNSKLYFKLSTNKKFRVKGIFLNLNKCRIYILWRRKWQPTPVFLPGESHGQRSLAGYSPWGRKELDTTEHPCKHRM